MAQTLTVLTTPLEFFGRKRVVYGTGDANGSATGSVATGLSNIEVCFVSNSENKSEDIQVVKNSNNGTEGSSAGDIYFSVADSTNNTWYWIAFGT